MKSHVFGNPRTENGHNVEECQITLLDSVLNPVPQTRDIANEDAQWEEAGNSYIFFAGEEFKVFDAAVKRFVTAPN